MVAYFPELHDHVVHNVDPTVDHGRVAMDTGRKKESKKKKKHENINITHIVD